MITHVIFDNNGVLTTNDEENTYKCIADFLGTSVSEAASFLLSESKYLDLGEITQGEFYARVLQKGNFNFSVEDLSKVHLNAYVAKPEVQDLAKQIGKKYKIALLTNFGDAFWQMFEKWKLNEIFKKNEVFLSAELHMAKPDPGVFLHALKKIKAKPNKTLFIDDNAENVKTARSLGINSILYKDFSSLRKSLASFCII